MTFSGTKFALTWVVIPTSTASTAVCGACTWRHHWLSVVVSASALELFGLLCGGFHAEGDLQSLVQVQFGLRKENLLNVLVLHPAD